VRLVATLSVLAIYLTVGGLGFDLYVLATHQLTGAHRIRDIALLFGFGLLAYESVQIYRAAYTRSATLQSHVNSN
jgi:hypothetical protein